MLGWDGALYVLGQHLVVKGEDDDTERWPELGVPDNTKTAAGVIIDRRRHYTRYNVTVQTTNSVHQEQH